MTKPLNEGKPTEAAVLFIRQANSNEAPELVIGPGNGSCVVYRLRPTQLKSLVIEGTKIALGSR